MSEQSDTDKVLAEIKRARAQKRSGNGTDGSGNAAAPDAIVQWPQPKPLPSGLPPVHPFDLAFMPDALRPWIDDIANRLQCPPDYVAISAIVALGSVIGRRVGIKPQVKTDWVEFVRSSGVRGC
jgi:hypothetical protein